MACEGHFPLLFSFLGAGFPGLFCTNETWFFERRLSAVMPLQARITIAGLGAGSPGEITLGVWEALKFSPLTFFRTERHPVVRWLREKGISFSTFDYIYEEEQSFQQVYRRIAEKVLEAARRGQVLYAVPGHPLVAEESVHLIVEQAEQEGVSVHILPAASFLDALCTALRLDPGRGLQVVDGLTLDRRRPSPGMAAVVTQVYSPLVASDVKLSLLEIYPAGHPVTVVRGAGIPGEERIRTVPLFELDRLDGIDHLTSVFVPPLAPQAEVAGDGGQASGGREGPEEPQEVEVIRTCEKSILDPAEDGVEEGCPAPDGDGGCRFPLDPLVDIMARLRGENGCPWDREQDHRTLKPYLLEEAYEVIEALDEEDMYKTCEELGDLLLQIVFHAQIAAENRHFDINDVIAGISEKMIRRHPHVFGSARVRDSGEVIRNWERIKAKEKGRRESILAGVPAFLPALVRAEKLQEKAAEAGFDWPDYRGALEKVREELDEIGAVVSAGNKAQIEKEVGDLIFSVVNLARLLGVNPEAALTGACGKFVRRFQHIEEMARAAGRDLSLCTLTELDEWWEEAKELENQEKNKG
ncbi:MAG: nucleoside triphosphate pyrophosphohydrolase [Pelotomaculum sp.]|nr:nucleoside triphosphate pyrophosphohydrolase [Pelotomaculum sp.]